MNLVTNEEWIQTTIEVNENTFHQMKKIFVLVNELFFSRCKI